MKTEVTTNVTTPASTSATSTRKRRDPIWRNTLKSLVPSLRCGWPATHRFLRLSSLRSGERRRMPYGGWMEKLSVVRECRSKSLDRVATAAACLAGRSSRTKTFAVTTARNLDTLHATARVSRLDIDAILVGRALGLVRQFSRDVIVAAAVTKGDERPLARAVAARSVGEAALKCLRNDHHGRPISFRSRATNMMATF